MYHHRRVMTLALQLAIFAGACSAAYAADRGRGDDRDTRRGDEKLEFVKQLDVGQGRTLGSFDISFVDPRIELYVLADRTNASVDLFDSENATFIGRVGTQCTTPPTTDFCFQGAQATTSVSGPDGVLIVGHKEIWAGDGDSKVKVIDIATRSFITTISTEGKFRVDEMAYDPRDHLLAAANNADTPPFVTVFDTNAKTITGKLVFEKGSLNADVDAQMGIEQPQWSPETGLFYISVPQVGPDPSIGGVSVIDPHTLTVTGTFLVKNCSPAGLALGRHHEALVGCGGAFGTPQTTQSVIIDITSTGTDVDDAVVARIPIGGSDEVWYDKGTQHYFLGARSNLTDGKANPILGSIDAKTHKLDPSQPSSLTAHSVAADKNSHYVFLPIGIPTAAQSPDPTNICPTTGCVAVYRAHPEHTDEEIAQRESDHPEHD